MSAVLKDLTISLPMAQPRPSERVARGRAKSPARRSVEAVLQLAHTQLTPAEVSARSGVGINEVRKQLCNICKAGDAHNAFPGARTGAKYAWGQAPTDETATPPPEPPDWRNAGHYDGRELRPFSGRPGAMDAFALPSLQAGERVARRIPMIIAGKPEVRK